MTAAERISGVQRPPLSLIPVVEGTPRRGAFLPVPFIGALAALAATPRIALHDTLPVVHPRRSRRSGSLVSRPLLPRSCEPARVQLPRPPGRAALRPSLPASVHLHLLGVLLGARCPQRAPLGRADRLRLRLRRFARLVATEGMAPRLRAFADHLQHQSVSDVQGRLVRLPVHPDCGRLPGEGIHRLAPRWRADAHLQSVGVRALPLRCGADRVRPDRHHLGLPAVGDARHAPGRSRQQGRISFSSPSASSRSFSFA